MKKNILICISMLWLIVIPRISHAAITGEQILRACVADMKNPEESTGKVFCLGYLSGYLDSYMISSEIHNAQKKLFCLPPKGISNTEAANIIVEYLQKNPGKLQQSARSIIILAFIQKFPCK